MLFLSIPRPCHENWDEMSPNELGAFCKACSKTVIDFTTKSDEEVRNYFLQGQGKTCGRFRNNQLIDTENLLPQLLTASVSFWKKFLAIVLVLFGSFLSGCEKPLKGKVAVSTSQTTVERFDKKHIVVGYIMPEIIPDTIPDATQNGKPQIKECTLLKDETDVIMGDIEQIPVQTISNKEIIQDTVRIIKPESSKSETLRKKLLDKNDCEITKTDSTNRIIL